MLKLNEKTPTAPHPDDWKKERSNAKRTERRNTTKIFGVVHVILVVGQWTLCIYIISYI